MLLLLIKSATGTGLLSSLEKGDSVKGGGFLIVAGYGVLLTLLGLRVTPETETLAVVQDPSGFCTLLAETSWGRLLAVVLEEGFSLLWARRGTETMLPILMYEFTTLELPIPELVSAADSSVPSLFRFKALLEGSVMMVGRMSLLLESWYCSIPRLRVGVGCGG